MSEKNPDATTKVTRDYFEELSRVLHVRRGGRLSVAETRKIIGPVTLGISPSMTMDELREEIGAHRRRLLVSDGAGRLPDV